MTTSAPPERPIDRVLERIPHAIRVGRGWRDRCPVCAGRSRALSVAEGDDGSVLLRCHRAHCSAEAICCALGLAIKQLFVQAGTGTAPFRPVKRLEKLERIIQRLTEQLRYRPAVTTSMLCRAGYRVPMPWWEQFPHCDDPQWHPSIVRVIEEAVVAAEIAASWQAGTNTFLGSWARAEGIRRDSVSEWIRKAPPPPIYVQGPIFRRALELLRDGGAKA